VSQDVDVQLQVWKDLAISKQILMGAATDALGLDSECTTDELKTALDQAIQRARDADINIQQTRSQAEQQIADYKARTDTAEKARAEAEEQVAVAVKAREQAEQQLTKGKADNAEALKKARAEVTDKQNKLKAISKSLADTPENVVRKLKTLKKQKMDEAKLRTQAESRLQSMRKEKNKNKSATCMKPASRPKPRSLRSVTRKRIKLRFRISTKLPSQPCNRQYRRRCFQPRYARGANR
jgi:hypothetical protein